MTVIAGTESRTSGSIAAELRALLRTAQRRDRSSALIATTRAAVPCDPIALFAAARSRGLEAALWLQPATHRSIVGIGRSWATDVAGPDRFSEVDAAWRAVLADAVMSGTGIGLPQDGPVLLGGLGFTGDQPPADDPWASFGPASLVLPTFGVARHGDRSSLTVAVRRDQAGDLDMLDLERRWQALAADAADAADAAADDDGEWGRMTAALESRVEPGSLRVVAEHPDRAAWDRTVGLFAGAVGRGRIDKVVLARRVVFRAAVALDVISALRHLAATAPESTTFAFARDGVTFLGATPERLLRTIGRSFQTVAIAGSAARGRDPDEDARLAAALMASEKDREEHAVVVAMLRDSLAPMVETMEIPNEPTVMPLRHVQHLVTPVTGTLREEAGLLALARRLHPTPAVGGAPRDMALRLITEHEGFERGWYAGPVGWLGADGDGELVVALRCGLVAGAQATLFAGCGIVADSDPASEWEESRLKFRTMIAALGGVQERAR